MSWLLRLTTWEEFKRLREDARTDADRVALVGLCWFATDSNHERLLNPEGAALGYGAHYRNDWLGKRRGFFICMPTIEADNLGFQIWCPDRVASDGSGEGWKVEGDVPNVTISPSINCTGTYHGWVKDGVLTDDCEGRQYGWATK